MVHAGGGVLGLEGRVRGLPEVRLSKVGEVLLTVRMSLQGLVGAGSCTIVLDIELAEALIIVLVHLAVLAGRPRWVSRDMHSWLAGSS